MKKINQATKGVIMVLLSLQVVMVSGCGKEEPKDSPSTSIENWDKDSKISILNDAVNMNNAEIKQKLTNYRGLKSNEIVLYNNLEESYVREDKDGTTVVTIYNKEARVVNEQLLKAYKKSVGDVIKEFKRYEVKYIDESNKTAKNKGYVYNHTKVPVDTVIVKYEYKEGKNGLEKISEGIKQEIY